MARRKKSPATVDVDIVLWLDADGKFRSLLDTSPVHNQTVGMVVHEDDNQVVLAHEISVTDDWLEQELDYTKIPKVLIIKRSKLGTVPVGEEDAAQRPSG